MFKLFSLRIVTEAEVQKLVDNTFSTAARLAMGRVDTSKPLTAYEEGRSDAAADIILMVHP